MCCFHLWHSVILWPVQAPEPELSTRGTGPVERLGHDHLSRPGTRMAFRRDNIAWVLARKCRRSAMGESQRGKSETKREANDEGKTEL